LFREFVEQRLDQKRLPVGIEIDDVRTGGYRSRRAGNPNGNGEGGDRNGRKDKGLTQITTLCVV